MIVSCPKEQINAIIGNPPYQIMDGGAGASAVPVYNKFMELGKHINPHFISLIIPARWYSGGRGLDAFRKAMLEDKRIELLYDYVDALSIFNNVEIKGGICYFLWNSKWNDVCNIITHTTDSLLPLMSKRYLKEENDDIFIRDPRVLAIKSKVTNYRQQYKEKTFDKIVSSMKPYGLRGDFFKDPHKYGLPHVTEKSVQGGIKILGLGENMRRTYRYAPKDYPLPTKDGIEDYKIFIPRNWGTGKLEDSIYKTHLAEPFEVCTETFLQIYPFKTEEERDNCNKYLSTKFFRMLVNIVKQDQGAGKDVYSFVPIQDFAKRSKIDWTCSISDIDRQLYNKYGLTTNEIEFIERMIKPMEN